MKRKIRRSEAFLLVLAGILLFMAIGPKLGLFSILPSGQYSVYGDCEFVSNVNVESSYSEFDNGAWISIDVNGDGKLDLFGYYDSGEKTSRTAECGGGQESGYSKIIDNFNSFGDDIYYKNYFGVAEDIFICNADGTAYKIFKKSYNIEGAKNCWGDVIGFPDYDADGIKDSEDNCKFVWNPSQSDTDNDGLGNQCDPSEYGRCGDNICQTNNVRQETLATCPEDCENYVPICTNGQSKCQGTEYFICKGEEWDSKGNINGLCGYSRCTYGDTTCINQYFYTCPNGEWSSMGLVDGKCGYSVYNPGDENTASESCSPGNTTCINQYFYSCVSGEWVSNGLVDGQCGYTSPEAEQTETSLSLSSVIFTIGGFEVTLLMLLILGGAIFALLLIK